ncbi:DUF6328 family protein [Kineosporia sp. R_H_3]|uniref:DUF6328 family protein n=1 Tax=Kineosporia sp. R_H_3 TaxID=1961848 RepID=UPI00117B286C|nr:DUF6328 family protein [Kineosporia sp. R_H_3]
MTSGRPGETDDERADRNFGEILQELRVSQTGVAVLFGFLLTMPMQQRFSRFDDVQRYLLVADVLLLATASALMVAPVAWHRVLFRQQMKDEVVLAANRLAQLGLLFLAAGVVTSILLVIDLAISRASAVVWAAVIGTLILVLWAALPLRRRLRGS